MTEGEKAAVKLRASYLNSAALILLSLGGLAPLVVTLQTFEWRRVIFSAIWLGIAVLSSRFLHETAQNELLKLHKAEEDR
jgi:hypothetical protein